MPEVYYYVKSELMPDIMDCGIKLSSCYDREIEIDGEKKLAFSGLINPKDDLDKYKSKLFKCIKVQVKNENCYIADRFIYENILNVKDREGLYFKSIIPVQKYLFGSYRTPECLITSTILPEDITVLDKRMDSPVIYFNAEELYINNLLQEFREEIPEFDDCLLYNLFNKLAQFGKLDKIEDITGKAIFMDNSSSKIYCIKNPNFDIEL